MTLPKATALMRVGIRNRVAGDGALAYPLLLTVKASHRKALDPLVCYLCKRQSLSGFDN